MKLFFLKLVSLFSFLGTLLILLLAFGVEPAAEGFAALRPYLSGEGEAFALAPAGYLTAVAILLLSLYALLPRMPRKRQTLVFPGDHGDIVLQLDTVRATLSKILRNMEEVRSIKLDVAPNGDGTQAVISADVVLNRVPGLSTREATRRVSHYIRHAAGNVLGLEDLATIRLNVVGVKVNAKASSKDLLAIPGLAGAPVAEQADESEALFAEEASETPVGENRAEAPREEPEQDTPPSPEPGSPQGEPEGQALGSLNSVPDVAEIPAEDTPVLVDTAPVMTPWEEEASATTDEAAPCVEPMPSAFVTPIPAEPEVEAAPDEEPGVPEGAEQVAAEGAEGEMEGEAFEEDSAEEMGDSPADSAFHADEVEDSSFELPPLTDGETDTSNGFDSENTPPGEETR